MNTTATPAATQDRSASVYMGVALDINNRVVNLAPTTPINKIDTLGLELELPENLYLGKLGDGINALVGQFSKGFDVRKYEEEAKDIPALQNIIKKVNEAEITIQDLHVKIPPKPKAKEGEATPPVADPTLYTVALAATWSGAASTAEKLTSDFDITLKGLYLMVTNETQEEIEMRRARAKAIQKKAQDAMILEAATTDAVAEEPAGTADPEKATANGSTRARGKQTEETKEPEPKA